MLRKYSIYNRWETWKFKHNSEDLTGEYVESIQSAALEGTILNTNTYKIMKSLSLFMQSEL